MGRTLLVIGGAGYVGSHFVRYASDNGCAVTVFDNFSTGHREAIRGLKLIEGDLSQSDAILEVLKGVHFDGIFHFAASCLVGESMADPAKYYQNNVLAAFNMLEAMRATGHDRLVFSSTCAVYGIPEQVPIGENHPRNPISPYGRSKLAIEWMLEDYARAYGLRSASLRYFNAAGCEPSNGLGEDHDPETHLIPNVVRYALGLNKELVIFGDDYPTPDGTCIRDYIHVTDLAEAHIKALDGLEHESSLRMNLGTGKGYSNLEVVDAVRRAVGTDFPYQWGPRRPGDPPELVADPARAIEALGWQPVRSDMDKIVGEAVAWFSTRPGGYEDEPIKGE